MPGEDAIDPMVFPHFGDAKCNVFEPLAGHCGSPTLRVDAKGGKITGIELATVAPLEGQLGGTSERG